MSEIDKINLLVVVLVVGAIFIHQCFKRGGRG